MIRLARTFFRRLRRKFYAGRVAALCAQQDRTFTEIAKAQRQHRPTGQLLERQRQTAHQILRLTQ